MDYIYGNLNKDVIDPNYTGKSSSTAEVYVDQYARTIAVDVPALNISSDLEDGSYMLKAVKRDNKVYIMWAPIASTADNGLIVGTDVTV